MSPEGQPSFNNPHHGAGLSRNAIILHLAHSQTRLGAAQRYGRRGSCLLCPHVQAGISIDIGSCLIMRHIQDIPQKGIYELLTLAAAGMTCPLLLFPQAQAEEAGRLFWLADAAAQLPTLASTAVAAPTCHLRSPACEKFFHAFLIKIA